MNEESMSGEELVDDSVQGFFEHNGGCFYDLSAFNAS